MKVSAKLAKETPTCPCGGYVDAGDKLETIDGTCKDRPAWWVACPDCGKALGHAHIRTAMEVRK